MSPRANKTFFRFFFGFVAIICVAFAILITAGAFSPDSKPVDNVAVPQ